MRNQIMRERTRRSERVLLRIPIRVEGNDALGCAFEETSYTLVVNGGGGLIALWHELKPGGVIRITNIKSQVTCSFEVVMRAGRSLSGDPEWGVKCLELEVGICGVHFPAKTEEPAAGDLAYVLLECEQCFSREVAALTAKEFRGLTMHSSLPRPCRRCQTATGWTPPPIEADPEGSLAGLLAPFGPKSHLAAQV
jgi:hypothetical protein